MITIMLIENMRSAAVMWVTINTTKRLKKLLQGAKAPFKETKTLKQAVIQ